MAIEPLTLRLASRADAPAIAALSRDRIERGLGWRWTAPRVLRSIGDRETNVAVAPQGDRLLGFGLMKYLDDEAHLLLLAVAADAVRGGVGAALVAWLERSARVAGVREVVLEARAGNAAARAFYGRLGYREVGLMPGYYQGVEDCVRIAKDLRRTPVAPG